MATFTWQDVDWFTHYIHKKVGRTARRRLRRQEVKDVILCVADHYEPTNGRVPREHALQRVEHWKSTYPQVFGTFRDAEGRPPRQTFFYQIDGYDADHVDGITELCRAGYGEIEIHLHHGGEGSAWLEENLATYRDLLAERHGMLARNKKTGRVQFGFIHGNWALDNSLPDGNHCGVNDELRILKQVGCYADFTLPSYPSLAQTRTVNSIYYAFDSPTKPKSHDRGRHVGTVAAENDGLLMVQGPLVPVWQRDRPRLYYEFYPENSNLGGRQVATITRLKRWLLADVHVPQRPDWVFVKLHTHGAPEKNREATLGAPMIRFHQDLKQWSTETGIRYHYVTAREVYNLVRAAEAGWSGDIAGALDFELTWNGAPK